MPKSNNPLSDARRGDDKAREIWFRKAGLGYHCFIEYYALLLQKKQEISDTISNTEGGQSTSSTSKRAPSSSCSQEGGLSRAAKKRRKKKKNGQKNTAVEAVESKTTYVLIATNDLKARKHPLYQAWQQHQHIAQHLHHFVQTLSSPLPVTLRIRHNADPQAVRQLRSKLKEENNGLRTVVADEIYQLDCSKASLPPSIKDIVLNYSQSGVLARQELGSMLPVLLLAKHLESAKSCLDLCASPGSKTLQALEQLQSNALLVANDVHPGRLDALRDAVRRSGVPDAEARIMFTCQNATTFELLRTANNNNHRELVQFDVILCDVPCSGDGTCRKDRHILSSWKPNIGNELHETQLAILKRGIELLKPNNGRLCYSTCSMNPVENEAVVAAALQTFDTVELVDIIIEDIIQGVELQDGLSHWKVAEYSDREDDDEDDDTGEATRLTWWSTVSEAVSANKKKLSSSLWPPLKGQHELPLSKCKRLWPQEQDSGGFFLAVLRKRD